MKYKCRMGHVGPDSDFCHACLASDFGVRPFQEPAEKSEDVTAVIAPPRQAVIKHSPSDDVVATEIPEGAHLPQSMPHGSSKPHVKR